MGCPQALFTALLRRPSVGARKAEHGGTGGTDTGTAGQAGTRARGGKPRDCWGAFPSGAKAR